MSKVRENWIDVARATACMMVVVLHTVSAYIPFVSKGFYTTWNVVNLIDTLTRVCVPLFFMISGSIFLHKKPITIRHISRVIACAIFYSAIALLYVYYINQQDAINRLKMILIKPAFYHLWFFYSIVIAYLMFSFSSFRKSSIKFTCVIMFVVFTICNQNLYDSLSIFGIKFTSAFSIKDQVVFLVLYGFAGAMVSQSERLTKKGIENALTLMVASYFSIFMLTWYSSLSSGRYVSTFYEYQNPLVFVASVSLMMIIKNIDYREGNVLGIARFISMLSLPIYGIHALILDYLYRYGYRNTKSPIADNITTFLIVMLASIAVSLLIKKLDRKSIVS